MAPTQFHIFLMHQILAVTYDLKGVVFLSGYSIHAEDLTAFPSHDFNVNKQFRRLTSEQAASGASPAQKTRMIPAAS